MWPRLWFDANLKVQARLVAGDDERRDIDVLLA
jgi:hypothetical protein